MPSPAATVVVVRERARGAIEVFLVRRHRASQFMSNAFVFPGGKVDSDDASAAALGACHGLDMARAARCFPGHDSPAPLAFWVAAVRELLVPSTRPVPSMALAAPS